MKMSNFVSYTPEFKAFGEGVQYFCDDQGRDFYESRELFKKKFVLFFDEHGIIRGVAKSTEVTQGNPLGLSVVDINALPKDFSLSVGVWKFDGKKVVPADFDPVFSTSRRKAHALSHLAKVMAPLQDAVELEDATEEEAEKYSNLRRLRVKLMRISDDTPPSEVDWTEFTTA